MMKYWLKGRVVKYASYDKRIKIAHCHSLGRGNRGAPDSERLRHGSACHALRE